VQPRGNDYSIAKATRDLLEKFRKENKPIGSICVGERVLLVHGVLKGKSAVRAKYFAEKFPGMAVDPNVKWKDKERVLTDGKVVTADGPQEARAFADAIVKLVLE
jgi:putative intracellular protease/amidase